VGQKPAKGEKVERLSTVELYPRQEPPPPVEMVEVPSVVGKSLKDARSILFENGFTPQTGKPKFSGKTPGLILDQNPDGKTKAPKGSVVQLIPEKQSVVVPDLRNQPLVDAILKIRNADLDWEGASELSTRVPAGTILEQNPKAGTRAEEGTEIKITVAKAPASDAGTPKWCSNFNDLQHLHSKDISEVTRLLGKVMPRNYVSALQLEPRSPAQRWSGEHVGVTFSYATEHGNDAMIFVVPAAHGKEIAGATGLKFRTQPDGHDTFKGSFTSTRRARWWWMSSGYTCTTCGRDTSSRSSTSRRSPCRFASPRPSNDRERGRRPFGPSPCSAATSSPAGGASLP
jgi:hypothetical protein